MSSKPVDYSFADKEVWQAWKQKDYSKALSLTLERIKECEEHHWFVGRLAWLYEQAAKIYRRYRWYDQEIILLEMYFERINHVPFAMYELAIAARLAEVRRIAEQYVPGRGTCEVCGRANMVLSRVASGQVVCRTCKKPMIVTSKGSDLVAASVQQIASWMYQMLLEHDVLDQFDVAAEIRVRFGEQFLIPTRNGGHRIIRPILKEFKKLASQTAVWDGLDFCWRKRNPLDSPRWGQFKSINARDRANRQWQGDGLIDMEPEPDTGSFAASKYSNGPPKFSWPSVQQFERLEVPLVGESYHDPDGYDRQSILATAFPSTQATLVREPTNIHDGNAIAVIVRGRRVGYLPATTAAEIAPIIDSGEWEFVVSEMRIEYSPDSNMQYSGKMVVEIRRPRRD